MLVMKWISRIRSNSSSSTCSYSTHFSNQSTDTYDGFSHSIELEHLYNYAKEEINYAQESQGSVYYEGDQQTAYDALAACEHKYDIILQQLQGGYSMMNVMQFKSKWEAELFQLRVLLNSLP